MRHLWFFTFSTILLLAACQSPATNTPAAGIPAVTKQAANTPQPANFKLSSPAFQDSGSIPQKFTCQGESVSPELNWSGAPANTQSFALIVDDPDAPGGTFTHWILFDLPADTKQLAEGAGAKSTASPIGVGGNNDAYRPGYTGPCPPTGSHRYYFRLYALDVPSLNLKEGATRSEVENALKSHILGTAETMGRYAQQ